MDTTYTSNQLLTHIGQDYRLVTVEIRDNQLTVLSEPPSHLVERLVSDSIAAAPWSPIDILAIQVALTNARQ